MDVSTGGVWEGTGAAQTRCGESSEVQSDPSCRRFNLFNIANLATLNGTLTTLLFGNAQSVAGGSFASPALVIARCSFKVSIDV